MGLWAPGKEKGPGGVNPILSILLQLERNKRVINK